ncbi:MAG: hypothetical protein ACK4VW_09860, partial [Anaerolineales bacterium]
MESSSPPFANSGKKNLSACLIIVFVLFCVGAFAVGIGTIALLSIFSPLSQLEVNVEAPENLYQDDAFDLIVRVYNPSDRPVTLSQIDIQHGRQI